MYEMAFLLSSTLLALFIAVVVLWIVSIRLSDVSIIDLAFGVLMALGPIVAWLLNKNVDEQANIMMILVAVWALRYTRHIVRRNLGKGEDPRYTKLRDNTDDGWAFHWYSLKVVFFMQGAVIWLATMPAQLGIYLGESTPLSWITSLGIIVWLIGFFFESVSDEQLRRFKTDPNNKGKILTTGLWAYSRHPNYFGELTMWWGLFIIALENPLLVFTCVGPLLYTYVVVNITGKAVLDKKMTEERPGYAAYIKRTSGLIPWFPKPSDQDPK